VKSREKNVRDVDAVADADVPKPKYPEVTGPGIYNSSGLLKEANKSAISCMPYSTYEHSTQTQPISSRPMF
jgi:hypothetical protein